MVRRQAGLPQVKDFSIEFTALVASRPAQAIKLRGSLFRWFRLGFSVSGHLGRHGLSGGADRLAMATDGQTRRFAQVLENMPAVGDLRCIGSTATGALGIIAGTIARDELDARTALQPGCDCVGI